MNILYLDVKTGPYQLDHSGDEGNNIVFPNIFYLHNSL